MMSVRNVKATLLVLTAGLVCAVPAAHAAMYQWTDDSDTPTFSDQAPPEPDKVRDLTVIGGSAPRPAISGEDPQRVEPGKKTGAIDTQPKPQQPSHTRAPAKFGESFRPETPQVTESAAAARQELDATLRELARVQARGRTEAVRDPCLLSSDPRCYERNKDSYHPYLGYAPSVMQSAATPAGATSTGGAGGAVSGQAPREAPMTVRHVNPAAMTTGVR